MGFLVLLARAIHVLYEIRKLADFLKSLSDPGGLRNLIQSQVRSLIIREITSSAIALGIAVDKLEKFDLLEQAESWALAELKKNDEPLASLNLDPIDLISELDRHLDQLRRGQAIGNSPNPLINKGRAADPILLYRGEFQRGITDLEVSGAGIDFKFIRTYRSGTGYIGPLGLNWDHSYNLRLRQEDEFIIVRLTGRLSEERYIKHPRFGESTEFSYFVPQDGVYDVILQDGAGSYILKHPQGIMYRYESTEQIGEHRIKQIEDRFGNNLKFVYSDDDKLQQVFINSDARFVNFSYDSSGRINKIEDHGGKFE